MKNLKNVSAAFAVLIAVGLAFVSYSRTVPVTQGYRAGVSSCTLQPIANISGSQNCDPTFTFETCKIQVSPGNLVDAYADCSAATNPVTVSNVLHRNN